MNGINSYKYIVYFGYYDRYKNRAYGLSSFQFFENFEFNKCNDIDVRYIRVVYEHFISIKMKLKYFDELGVIYKQQKEMVKFYDFAEI